VRGLGCGTRWWNVAPNVRLVLLRCNTESSECSEIIGLLTSPHQEYAHTPLSLKARFVKFRPRRRGMVSGTTEGEL